MEKEQHIERHKELHKKMDELLADYISCVPDASIHHKIITLMEWSYKQTQEPDEPRL